MCFRTKRHRTLPIKAICQMAGYRSVTPWYMAMRDDVFRRSVEALGMKVRHRHVVSKALFLSQNILTKNGAKDTIDVRRFVAEYPKHHARLTFTLDFSLSLIRN